MLTMVFEKRLLEVFTNLMVVMLNVLNWLSFFYGISCMMCCIISFFYVKTLAF